MAMRRGSEKECRREPLCVSLVMVVVVVVD